MSDEPPSPRNPERLPGRDSIRVASAAAQDQPAPRARLLVDLPTRVIYAIAPPDRNLRSIRIRNRGWWTRGHRIRTPPPPSGSARSTWVSKRAAPASTGTDAVNRGSELIRPDTYETLAGRIRHA